MKTLTIAGLSILLLALFFQCCPSTTPDGAAPPPPAEEIATETPIGTPASAHTREAAPTDTPVPPPDLISTPIPPPTQTTQPDRPLEVYGGHTYQQRDYFHVVGEVLNPTDQWLEYVKIVATFYDAADRMIGTAFTYTELRIIPPGDRSPFDLSTDATELGGEVDSYDLQVQARYTPDAPYQELVVEVSNQYDSRGYWHLEGLVRNAGPLDCEYVKIIAAFYDSNDQIVGVDFTYTELNEVSAGSQSPFDLGAADLPQWDHYRTWVQGRPIE